MSRRSNSRERGGSAVGVVSGPPPGTKPVDPLHAFPLDRLVPYLQQHCIGFRDALNSSGLPDAMAALQVHQFSHGQSNPTFALQINHADGHVIRRYVLRKKPSGKLLPSAHAIEREYRIMTALRGTEVPVPQTFCLCEDSSIIGTPFFVMAFVTGRVFKDIRLPGMSRIERFAIYHAMVSVLAALHRINPASVGLADYAGPQGADNYIARQVKRWSGQYIAAKTQEIPAVDTLMAKLQAGIPAPNDPDSKACAIVHGDFRLDNLMFHPREPRVIAVLDWELSTLGHPITDLAYNCMPYYVPAGAPLTGSLQGMKLVQKGLPSEKEYIAAYIREVRREGPIPRDRWAYLMALAFFRSASILQGVYKRSLQGNASQSDQSKSFIAIIPSLAELALGVLEGHVTPESHDASGQMVTAVTEQQFRATLSCFRLSDNFWVLHKKLRAFMDDFIYPNESTYAAQHAALKAAHGGDPWHIPPIIEDLKVKAKEHGLWNLFFTVNKVHGHNLGAGLTNVEYAPLCELMGRVIHMAPEIFSPFGSCEACVLLMPFWCPRDLIFHVYRVCAYSYCGAPDTGNMEVLANYGTSDQKERWLKPLMNGDIRSAFCMTEPAVASSDATNIECSIQRDGDEYVINGRKWWSSGICDPRCAILIVMGRTGDTTAPRHKQQSMILVEKNAPGVTVTRHLNVFGYDDAPHGHGEVVFTNVRVPASNMLLGEGRGFEIAQGRLGPGRIHHCMRLIGMAERGLETMLTRTMTRTAFGSQLATKGAMLKDIADSRIEIDSCRLLCMQAASMMDSVGNKLAAQQIGAIKVLAPAMCLRVLDRAIQAQGARGVCQDTPLPWLWAGARTLRLADGPDEVHRENIAKLELLRAKL